MTDRYDLVVVGAGPAGTVAAVRAAELGARVPVVESDRTVPAGHPACAATGGAFGTVPPWVD